MNKIKILHVNNTLELGGTSYLLRLTSLLNREHFKNYIAYCGDEFFISKVDKDIELFKYSDYRPSLRNLNVLVAPLRLFRFIRKQKIDIVHTYMLPSNLWGLIAGKSLSVPTVNTIVESILVGQFFSNLSLKYKPIRKCFDSFVTKYCALAQYSRQEYETYLGVHPSKIVFTGHGVDLERFRINPNYSIEIRNEFSVDNNTRIIASIARIAPEKGIDFFLRLLPSCTVYFH